MRIVNYIKDFLLLGLILLLASCLPACTSKSTRPDLVDQVKVAVEVPKPLPGWVTVALPLPPEADTVEQHLKREDVLEGQVLYSNCRAALADKIARGEKPDPATCGAAP